MAPLPASALAVVRGSGSAAALVILPSAFGVAPDLVAHMHELASDASLVVALDPFARHDPGVVAYDDMARVMARVHGHDPVQLQLDLREAIAWTAAAAERPVVVLGVCFGGPHALEVAAAGLVAGAAVWHGTGLDQQLGSAPAIRCPLALHFGADDPFVPPALVARVRETFAGRPNVAIHVHEGATHGFSHRGAPAWHEAAERAATASLRELVHATAHASEAQR